MTSRGPRIGRAGRREIARPPDPPAPLRVVIIERPDADSDRLAKALDILLEAAGVRERAGKEGM
jgi:hypothetical protein